MIEEHSYTILSSATQYSEASEYINLISLIAREALTGHRLLTVRCHILFSPLISQQDRDVIKLQSQLHRILPFMVNLYTHALQY